MNNMAVPVGLILNLLFWDTDADLLRLTLGGLIILASLQINRLGRRTA